MEEIPRSHDAFAWLYFLDTGVSTTDSEGRVVPSAINGRILRCRPDGSSFQEVLTDLKSLPDGIAIDPPNEHIYWTNMERPSVNNGSIQRCTLSGENVEIIVSSGTTFTPKQVAIAPISQKIYWADREGMKIMRANLDGSHIEVVYYASSQHPVQDNSLNWCVGIAVDERYEVIYWSQRGPSKGGQGRIFRMKLEMNHGEPAGNRSDIECLLVGLPEPIQLALDSQSQILYWTDRGDPPFGNTVNSVSLADSNGRPLPVDFLEPKILVQGLHEGIGIAIDLNGRRLFFTDFEGSLYSSKLDGSEKIVIFRGIGTIAGIAYIDK
ncbi:YWTD domain-containing protein [Penicillium angulare]|uniref:YWTD domain-containing protein n=1 Tax=Penicillium angulare TaxID=116970 RepID=A0A9W9ESZ8_9EURO|nr:YWTD domain-containing protein [Penicillium angulare]